MIVKPEMRRGKHRRTGDGADWADDDPDPADRQFVVALARGLNVLSAFKVKDAPLGNRELSERTGVPAATVSRLTHTLTTLGYLSFDARRETYDLGGSALALGHTALARLSVRKVALELMQELANRANANVGLGMLDRNMMLYAQTCEGAGPVGLRLFAGSRIPIASSAMGRAYLAGLPLGQRDMLLRQMERESGVEWPAMQRAIEKAIRSVHRTGFCLSLGEWQKDINGVAVPLVDPITEAVYAINLGGPAYILTRQQIMQQFGPQLVAMRNQILAGLRPPTPAIPKG